MRIASLCTGVGGLEALLPGELIWMAEYDKHASTVLAVRHPGVPNYGDVKTLDYASLETPDLLTAGYPCQPFSVAGLRKGSDDPRHLWPSVAETVRQLRPPRVLLENVRGHLTKGFDEVLGTLAGLGYDCRWEVLRASDVGAPHRRERVFILAADTSGAGARRDGRAVPRQTGEGGWPSGKNLATRHGGETVAHPDRQRLEERSERNGRQEQPRLEAPCWDDALRRDLQREAVANPDIEGLEGSQPAQRPELSSWGDFSGAVRRWEDCTRAAPAPTDDRGRLSPLFVEWMMGFPTGWVTSCGLTRTAELARLGNAVVPQVSALAWARLNERVA